MIPLDEVLELIECVVEEPNLARRIERGRELRRQVKLLGTPNPGPLTKRQAELVRFLVAYHREHGCAPTLDEVAEHFALHSTATVHEHLGELERKGYLVRQRAHQRGITLLDAAFAVWRREPG